MPARAVPTPPRPFRPAKQVQADVAVKAPAPKSAAKVAEPPRAAAKSKAKAKAKAKDNAKAKAKLKTADDLSDKAKAKLKTTDDSSDEVLLQAFLDHLYVSKSKRIAADFAAAFKRLIRLHGRPVAEMATAAYVGNVKEMTDLPVRYFSALMEFLRFRGREALITNLTGPKIKIEARAEHPTSRAFPLKKPRQTPGRPAKIEAPGASSNEEGLVGYFEEEEDEAIQSLEKRCVQDRHDRAQLSLEGFLRYMEDEEYTANTRMLYKNAIRRIVSNDGMSLKTIASKAFGEELRSAPGAPAHTPAALKAFRRYCGTDTSWPQGPKRAVKLEPDADKGNRRAKAADNTPESVERGSVKNEVGKKGVKRSAASPPAGATKAPRLLTKGELTIPLTESPGKAPDGRSREAAAAKPAGGGLTAADEAELAAFEKSLAEREYSQVSSYCYRQIVRRLVDFEGHSLDAIASPEFPQMLRTSDEAAKLSSSRGKQVATAAAAFSKFRAGCDASETCKVGRPSVSRANAAAVKSGEGAKTPPARAKRPPGKTAQAAAAAAAARSSTAADDNVSDEQEDAIEDESSLVITGFPFAMWAKNLIQYAKKACGPRIHKDTPVTYDALDNNKFAMVEFETKEAAGAFLEEVKAKPLQVAIVSQIHGLHVNWATDVFPVDD